MRNPNKPRKRHGGFPTAAERRVLHHDMRARPTPTITFNADLKYIPAEGDVKIYLDDECPCPEGWTLVRNGKELDFLLDPKTNLLERITDLSLDWYLGEGVPNGEVVAQYLAEKFSEDHTFLPNLEAIGFHSSDHVQGRKMLQILREVLEDESINRNDVILFCK